MSVSSASISRVKAAQASQAASEKLLHRLCPLCSRDNRSEPLLAYSREPWEIKQCGDCGFVYLENAPHYEQLVSELSWSNNSSTRKQESREREPWTYAFKRLYKRLKKQVYSGYREIGLIELYVRRGRVLDVGCGWGKALRMLDDCFTPYGVEIGGYSSSRAHEYASKRGGSVINDNALAGMRAFSTGFFDGILMHAYLEHELHPRAVLHQAYRILKPEGCVVIKVPNYNSWLRVLKGSRWKGFLLPDHVNYFTPNHLIQMVQQARLQVVRFGVLDRLPTSDNMWMIVRKPAAA